MTMGWAARFGGAVAMILLPGAGMAAENGVLVRADVLRDKPFIDAADLGKLAANAPVAIAARQGGWMQVDASGTRGWVRTLNVRLAGGGTTGGSGLLAASSAFRTGSSGTQVTTGVKGLGEAELRAAQPDMAQLAALEALAATPAEASAQAAANGLKPNQVAYLKPGKKK